MSPWRRVSFWVTFVLAVAAALMLAGSLALRPQARAAPLGAAVLTLLFLAIVLAAELFPRVARLFEIRWNTVEVEVPEDARVRDPDIGTGAASAETESTTPVTPGTIAIVVGSIALYATAIVLLGFVVATPLYILLFLRLFGGAGWFGSVVLAVGMTLAMVGLSWLLRADLYPGVLSGAQLPPF